MAAMRPLLAADWPRVTRATVAMVTSTLADDVTAAPCCMAAGCSPAKKKKM